MNYSLPTWFFGIFLLTFAIAVGFLAWRSPANRKLRAYLFVVLHLASLAFVLCFILFGWPKAESKFIEIGQYYPLSPTPNAAPQSVSSKPTISIGRPSQSTDFVIDANCQNEPCFSGQVNFWYESSPSAPNILRWEKTQDFQGALTVLEPHHGSFGQLYDSVVSFLPGWINLRRAYSDGNAGIRLTGETLRALVEWKPPPGKVARKPLSFYIVVELNPDEAPPRLIIEYPKPRIIELPNPRNMGTGEGSAANSPTLVYLTSSNPAVSPISVNEGGYVPRITLGAADPTLVINAYLEQPKPGTGDDFIINTGLRRTGNPFGRRVYIGAERGVVATVVTGNGDYRSNFIITAVILWLIPLGFFLFFLPISRHKLLFVFLPTIQLILAVRFVIGLRTYLWSPYSSEAIEAAVLAAIFIPLAVFIGCLAIDLKRKIGDARANDNWRLPWWRYISNYRPFGYYLIALLTLIFICFLFQINSETFASVDGRAFQDWKDNLRALAMLGLFSPLVWFVGAKIDRSLRGSSEKRKKKYFSSSEDPVTFRAIEMDEQPSETAAWSKQSKKWFALAVLFGLSSTSILFLWQPTSAIWQTVKLVVLVVLLLAIILTLYFFSLKVKPASLTWSIAAQNLATVLLIAGIFAGLSSVLGYRPEAIPFISVRTSVLFTLLILLLTMRLLSAFYSRWRNAEASLDWRGFWEVVVVFIAPALMLIAALIASHDTGALLVHGPALVGSALVVTGLWPLWKTASGRRHTLSAILVALVVLGSYYLIVFAYAPKIITNILPNHTTLAHRVLLRQGPIAASGLAATGGQELIGAIQQSWRMMNYAAEGGWNGRGYGNAPVSGSDKFTQITLSDLVFSVYILGEFGALGGLALLALYLLFFLLVLRMAWAGLKNDALQIALIVSLALLIVFPAIYMSAANVSLWIFTGQDMPLLGLRSLSDILLSGIVLMLLCAALKPLVTAATDEEQTAKVQPRWRRLIAHSLELLLLLFAKGRKVKATRLSALDYSPRPAAAAVATNITLVGLLLVLFAVSPIVGILQINNNEVYKKPLGFEELKAQAEKYIAEGHIWFEPIAQGMKPGDVCGKTVKNSLPANEVNLNTAFQLCIDDNVSGAAEGDTYYSLIKQWNSGPKRDENRGNLQIQNYDADQFFQLDLESLSSSNTNPEGWRRALTVNRGKYVMLSPFRKPGGWTGALTEANTEANNGGILVGSGIILPLRVVPFDDQSQDAYINYKDWVRVDMPTHETYSASRGFALYDSNGKTPAEEPIFQLEMVKGAMGALLRPKRGAFDLFINGCPVVAESDKDCKPPEGGQDAASGTALPLQLDDGDVIAYAPVDGRYQKRLPRYVFTYQHARVGAFAHMTWVNGEYQPFFPQGKSWPMARQIREAIADKIGMIESNKDIALTIDAGLNREVYDLLGQWRIHLDKVAPLDPKTKSSRHMAVTLMDSNTGDLLALGSDYGTPFDPNDRKSDEDPIANREDLNLIRHRIGSAVKPFTAAAALSTFPQLYQLTLIDRRTDKKKIFGIQLSSKRKIEAHDKGPTTSDGVPRIDWQHFLPPSDNLYAVTLALLGMCDSADTDGLPRFENSPRPSLPLELTLTDEGSSLGQPIWPSIADLKNRTPARLHETPLANQLEKLFDIRAGYPQKDSYFTKIWSKLEKDGLLSSGAVSEMRAGLSPEIPNFAFADINNFDDLRVVLLGSEFRDLPQFGRVGGAWSNIYLAQSFARITTGRKITARIIADNPPATEELFRDKPWWPSMLSGLEGVIAQPDGTARVLSDFIGEINRQRMAAGLHENQFRILSKTGTLDPDDFGDRNGPLLADSIYIFTAGIWNDATQTFERPVTGAIYIEQASDIGMLKAQALAAELLKRLNRNPRFKWDKS